MAQAEVDNQNDAIELIQKLTEKRSLDADKIALWKEIEETFGGRKQFVSEMKQLYDSCQKGSANKVRMGSLFLEIYSQAAALTKPSQPELELSDEAMAGAIRGFLQELKQNGT